MSFVKNLFMAVVFIAIPVVAWYGSQGVEYPVVVDKKNVVEPEKIDHEQKMALRGVIVDRCTLNWQLDQVIKSGQTGVVTLPEVKAVVLVGCLEEAIKAFP